jgi:hypothetical protein
MTIPMGQSPAPSNTFAPPQISNLDDTWLSPLWLQDLTLKILYSRGYISGHKIAEEIALPFAGVVDQLLMVLKQDKLIEVKSSQGSGLGEGSYTYGITGQGMTRAREALERSQYAGPAPVPFEIYNEAIRRQKGGRITVTTRTMRQILSQLLSLSPRFKGLARRLTQVHPSLCMALRATAKPVLRVLSATLCLVRTCISLMPYTWMDKLLNYTMRSVINWLRKGAQLAMEARQAVCVLPLAATRAGLKSAGRLLLSAVSLHSKGWTSFTMKRINSMRPHSRLKPTAAYFSLMTLDASKCARATC